MGGSAGYSFHGPSSLGLALPARLGVDSRPPSGSRWDGPHVPESVCQNAFSFSVFPMKSFCSGTFPLGSTLQAWG